MSSREGRRVTRGKRESGFENERWRGEDRQILRVSASWATSAQKSQDVVVLLVKGSVCQQITCGLCAANPLRRSQANASPSPFLSVLHIQLEAEQTPNFCPVKSLFENLRKAPVNQSGICSGSVSPVQFFCAHQMTNSTTLFIPPTAPVIHAVFRAWWCLPTVTMQNWHCSAGHAFSSRSLSSSRSSSSLASSQKKKK